MDPRIVFSNMLLLPTNYPGRSVVLQAATEPFVNVTYSLQSRKSEQQLSDLVLDSLLGSWAYVCQFRRPLFSLFHELYHNVFGKCKDQESFVTYDHIRIESIMSSLVALSWQNTLVGRVS